MDILMIYWNSVWTNSQRDRASLLSKHSGAELRAFERVLHGSPRSEPPRSAATPRPRDRRGGSTVRSLRPH